MFSKLEDSSKLEDNSLARHDSVVFNVFRVRGHSEDLGLGSIGKPDEFQQMPT